MARTRESSASTELRNYVLPDRKRIGNILTELHSSVNPCEVSDLVLGPFYEIMGNIKRGMR